MTAICFKNFDAFKKMQDHALPAGDWVTITQDMINSFAAATLDDQWIHIDSARAEKQSPFGKTVAHGFMSLSLVSAMIGDVARIESMKMGVNYGANRVRFPSPVPVNSRIRLNCRVGQMEELESGGLKVRWDCEVEMENSEKPACVCELIAVIFE